VIPVVVGVLLLASGVIGMLHVALGLSTVAILALVVAATFVPFLRGVMVVTAAVAVVSMVVR
jgi:hypothetical protein